MKKPIRNKIENKHVVYFFCPDKEKDPAGANILEQFMRLGSLAETDLSVDGYPVLTYVDPQNNTLSLVRTKVVICVDYQRYLPFLQTHFPDVDLAVMVNWHGGANAPDRVLCIHTVGDVASGTFNPAEPQLTTNIARAMEDHRIKANLTDFRVTSEATHWSGIVYDVSPELLSAYPVPFIDVEIGSTPESYANPVAAEVIARGLWDVFNEEMIFPVVLYCGGIHFEDTITAAVLHPEYPVSLSHILPSRWIENEDYLGEQGKERIVACLDSIRSEIAAIVIHEKLKREQRELLTEVAEELSIPFFKRKALKNMEACYENQGWEK